MPPSKPLRPHPSKPPPSLLPLDLGFLLPSKSASAASAPASSQVVAQALFRRALRPARKVLFLEAGRALRLGAAAIVAAGFSDLSLDHVRCSEAASAVELSTTLDDLGDSMPCNQEGSGLCSSVGKARLEEEVAQTWHKRGVPTKRKLASGAALSRDPMGMTPARGTAPTLRTPSTSDRSRLPAGSYQPRQPKDRRHQGRWAGSPGGPPPQLRWGQQLRAWNLVSKALRAIGEAQLALRIGSVG